ncbi:inverse autotransporter beta domain-containing protein, partial [Proteus mirabilis]
MDNFLLEKLRKNKFISYLLIMVQFLFPTVLSLTPTVHAYASATENKNTNSERWLAQQASQAGAILSSENSKDSASQYFFNQANNKINQEVENWLSQYGKAQINLGVDKNFTLKNT